MGVIVIAVLFTIAITLTEAHLNKKPKIEVFEILENQLTKDIHVQPVSLQYDLESQEVKINKRNKRVDNDATRDFLKKLTIMKRPDDDDESRELKKTNRLFSKINDRDESRGLLKELKDFSARQFLESNRELEKKNILLNKLKFQQKPKNKADLASRSFLNKLKTMKEQNDFQNKQNEPLILILAPQNDVFDLPVQSDNAPSGNYFVDKTRTQSLGRPETEIIYHIVPPKGVRKTSKEKSVPYILRSQVVGQDRTMIPRYDRNYDDK